jgi:transposase
MARTPSRLSAPFLLSIAAPLISIVKVVCAVSQAFLSGVAEHLPSAGVTIDWFHIMQTFTKATDEVRKRERTKELP